MKEGKIRWKECTIDKISRKGMGVTFHEKEKINIGSMLQLKIFISKKSEYFTVKGIVKWLMQRETNAAGGIELTKVLSETEWIQLIFFIVTPSENYTKNSGLITPRATRKKRHLPPPPKVLSL